MSFFHSKEVMGEDGFCLSHLKCVYILLDTRTIEKKGEKMIYFTISAIYTSNYKILVNAIKTLMSHIIETKLFNNIFK